MTFTDFSTTAERLEANVSSASQALSDLVAASGVQRSAMGLLPDSIRLRADYIAATKACSRACQQQRDFNASNQSK